MTKSKDMKPNRPVAEKNIRFFEETYLRHHFSAPGGRFHEELDAFLREAGHCVVEAPRGHGKSTKITLSFLLHHMLYKHARHILLISETSDQASRFLQAIRYEMESNTKLIKEFGPFRTRAWSDRRLITATGACLQVFGEGQKIRGSKFREFRPDLIVVDDPESLATTQSAAVRRKRRDWFHKEVLGALDPKGKVVLIGTAVHHDGLLRRVMRQGGFRVKQFKAVLAWPRRMKLWAKWEEILRDYGHGGAKAFHRRHRREMKEGAEVLWPRYWDIYRLMLRRFEMGSVAFAAEFQNEPVDPEARRFKEEWIRYYESTEIEGLPLAVFIAVDPSLGAKELGDFSAIVVGGVVRPERLYILESIIRRMSPGDLIAAIFRLCLKWRPMKVGIESNNFQVLLAQRLRERSAESGAFIPVQEMVNHADKVLRITAIAPLVENGIVRFRKEDGLLIEQLLHFPKGEHDDGPDALEMLVRLGRGAGRPEAHPVGRRRIGATQFDFFDSHRETREGY
ncbi:MAG: phage terminase large subunit [Planctomycetes bacterium]|nr:phage terminase large subunit [Planctomycetota bacterium]